MITKEELLQKGISEEIADEIISKIDSEEDESSLQLLQKALGDPKVEDLSKADGGDEEGDQDDDDDKDDYNEKYMKKHMKRYMKANKSSCSKMMKEVGEKMTKAIDDIDLDSEGAVVEMTDLAPFLESQKEFNESLTKALGHLAEEIVTIKGDNEKSYDLLKKAASVQVEQAAAIDGFLNTPQGRKSKVVADGADLSKASKENVNDQAKIYTTLMKAVKNGDTDAGAVISAYEVAGKNVNRLNDNQRAFISDLLSKEAK